MFPVQLDIDSRDGAARSSTASTHRGTYETPCFMPVGTRGAVKYLSARDYTDIGARIVLGNTYHLMLRPGADVVEKFGGLGSLVVGMDSRSRTRAVSKFFLSTQRLTMTE